MTETLLEAKAWLRARLDKGAKCPCCTQFAKMYERKLNSGMAACLIVLCRISQREGVEGWVYVPDFVRSNPVLANSREYPKLRYWGLVETRASKKPEVKDSGTWRPTAIGVAFSLNRTKIKSHVKLYDGRPFGFLGDEVSIVDCLGERFSYPELMGWETKAAPAGTEAAPYDRSVPISDRSPDAH